MKIIFLADDDADDRLIFDMIIKQISPELVLFPSVNCDDLIHVLKETDIEKPDIIFVDLNIPDEEAIACVDEMLSDRITHDIPLVILSTIEDKHQIEMMYEKGAALFITKSASLLSFRAALEYVLLNPDAFKNRSRANFHIK